MKLIKYVGIVIAVTQISANNNHMFIQIYWYNNNDYDKNEFF